MTIRGFRQGSVAQLAAVVTAALIAAGTPVAWAGPRSRPRRSRRSRSRASRPALPSYVDGQLKGVTPRCGRGDRRGRSHGPPRQGRLPREQPGRLGPGERPVAAGDAHADRGTRSCRPKTRGETGSREEAAPGRCRCGRRRGLAFLGLRQLLTTQRCADGLTVSRRTRDGAPGRDRVSLLGRRRTTRTGTRSSYAWGFGDGATGTGASTCARLRQRRRVRRHRRGHGRPRRRQLARRASRSRAWPDAGQADWTGSSPITFNLAQNGSAIAGSYEAVYPGNRSVAGTVTGSVTAPGRVTMTVRVPNYCPSPTTPRWTPTWIR